MRVAARPRQRWRREATFLCNWRLTSTAHEDGGLLVYVHPQTQEPLGYQWGGLVTSGILEICNDMRERGIGRELLAHCLTLAAEDGNDILGIQCKPRSSLPFWKATGVFSSMIDATWLRKFALACQDP